MKKKLVSLLLIAVMTGMMSVSAFAHGGHGKNRATGQRQQSHSVCTVADCQVAGGHKHSGSWCCGQYQEGYEVCTVSGCTQLGLHEHDGTAYYCASHGAEHGCGRASS